jgi:SAM-dependent methyltransferase
VTNTETLIRESREVVRFRLAATATDALALFAMRPADERRFILTRDLFTMDRWSLSLVSAHFALDIRFDDKPAARPPGRYIACMSFEVGADAYWRFIGRYSEKLAVELADYAGVEPGQRALDVGCGPGALSAVLAERLGPSHVAALDPSAPFVDAARSRLPGVDIRLASAESIPFDDDTFDVALAELVVHFMSDPVAGLREMARVTRPGGTIGACVWDYGTDTGALSPFWKVARTLDPGVDDESGLAGVRDGQLVELFRAASLRDIRSTALTVHVDFASFEQWWEPLTLGVGPAGAYVGGLSDEARAELKAACAASLPDGPFTIDASAWTTAAVV